MGKRKETSPVTPVGHDKRSRRDDDSEDESEYVEATPRASLGSKSFSESSTAEVGIIESISLKNFMCHSNLGPFRFGPNVNFVVGNNGSGKSAVLTALIVGLGGKAAITNRGSSIKGFVKDGQTSADVSITLRNRGEDAFKPEVYGDSITVQQHFTTDGSRSYKLKSVTGALVSSKKEELTAILDHFNIQVDNPVSVLTQEMSKHFLQSKNESDKYKFFMKATQLDQMKEDYSYIMETKNKTNDQVKYGVERLHELRRECMEKEERFKSIASLGEKQEKLEDLKRKMAWAVVNETEKQIKPFKEQLAAEENRTLKFEQKIEEWQEKVKNAEGRFKAIQEQLEKISQDALALKPQAMALKDDVQTKKKVWNEAEVFYNRHRMDLRRLERDSEQLRKRIIELQKSADNTSEDENMARMREIAELKEKLKALQDQEMTTNQQIEQFQQAIYRYKEERTRLYNEERDMKHKMEQQKRQLKELQDSKTDRLKRFGQNMPSLLQAINDAYNQGRFLKKPVGPLGACIRLKDPDLALAVESCLKGLLLAFCCDNHKDERTLQLLMSKTFTHGQRPQIIVNEFGNEVYNVQKRAVFHPNYPTVLTALEIDNPVVANCLIDMRGIETVLLIKNNSEAREVMQRRAPPRNCREAFTGEGDQVFSNRYYSSEYNRAKLLSGDVEVEISFLDKEVKNMAAQLSTVQQRVRSIEGDIKQNENYMLQYYNTKKRKQAEARELNARITELENVEEQPSIDIATLESEAQDIKNKTEHVRKEMKEAWNRMEDLKSSLQKSEHQYDEIKMKISSVSEVAEPVKDELHKVDQEVESCKTHKKHYEKKMAEHLEGIRKRKEELKAKEKDLEEKLCQAKQIFPERIEVTRSARSLDTEIVRLREKINSERDLHGDRDEVIRQYHAAKENYQDVESKVKNLKKFINLLDDIMTQRFKTYQLFRRCLTLRCKFYFDTLLSQRAYSGKISFDHKNETLSITVQPGEGNKAALSDMRSLSGGERSFSTVCFILSLWSIAESPFRCLDEFDVYMDMVNRRISMDMMLSMADSQRFRQFILLTPQNMSSLPSSTLIRILRMQDPDRGQTTLPFLPRGQEEENED
ncbi:structural maintenance of chromosomes 6 [Pelobates cultripes]|uniref:Structural maintenance of chromosomes protein 6 n=1 Tax=Pelobates cultripes TaxID=61616 RepID=A0AAD1RA26_PELCU|nr:structural maintenance of chromosomes 6 [Pelobates cultripes]CAH2246042.1 structural maintenance of chromosomes 6 [Pelobates cultripes]CAH2246043.1 structural maintenance of chromosomes 6 [Pelobates cultripes]CAH2246044.1 structural maintenance of chromosomes 6 [Pelobates cultripes]CAH2246045.1 structural maintenance of chromosomes 6 [Pelobates cultripes]